MERVIFIFLIQGNISVDRENRSILEKKPRTSGKPKISWTEDNGLSPASHPVAFMEAILCRKSTPDENKRWRNQAKVSILNYTNLKVSLCGAG